MAIGGFAAGGVFMEGYPVGSAAEMGPGYFPLILGIILIVMGLVVAVKGCKRYDPINWTGDFRPLVLLPVVVVAFGFLIDKIGLIIPLVLVVLGSSFSFRKVRRLETLILTVGIVVMVVAIFVWGLTMPLPLLKL
jgi:hypothetical protein